MSHVSVCPEEYSHIKFLCTVVKVLPEDYFVITAYYTDTIKRGDVLWTKK